jgi:ubiquinone/menaquinone biosynthesis C-methylase UbiE
MECRGKRQNSGYCLRHRAYPQHDSRYLPKASLYGVDLSPTYLRKANELLSEKPAVFPSWFRANAEALPFVDNYFEATVSVFLFHELPAEARQNVINEAYRVTKPGGTFVICDSIQMMDSPEFKVAMENFPARCFTSLIIGTTPPMT